MAKGKVSNDIEALRAQVKELKEQNQRLADALLLIKEQYRKERTEKEMYMSMYRKLEQQVKDTTAFDPLYMVSSTFVQSNRNIKGEEEEFERLGERAPMSVSMDPMMLQQHLKEKPIVKKRSLLKEKSGSSESERLKSEGGQSGAQGPSSQTTEKKLKTLKDLKLENNIEEESSSKEIQLEKGLDQKPEKARRMTYFDKVKSKEQSMTT